MAVYRLCTFGGLSLQSDPPHVPPTTLTQRKRLGFLALLAAAGDRGLPRDTVLALLWPDSDAEHARNVLYQTVHAIRRDLREDALQGTANLRLDPTRLSSDLYEFRTALAEGKLEKAADLYSGPFLDGVHLRDAPEFERWAAGKRRDIDRQYRETLERLAQIASDNRDSAAAARWWHRRALAEPYGGRVALQYMRALEASGQREAAIRHAKVYAALVRSELETEPDPAVLELAAVLSKSPGMPIPVGVHLPTAPAAEPHGAHTQPAIEPGAPHVEDVQPRTESSGQRLRALRLAGVAAVLVVALGVLFGGTRRLLPAAGPRVAGNLLTVGSARQVTGEPGIEITPAISPLGDFVAYSGGSPRNMQVFVRHLSGGDPVRVGEGRGPHWFPQGNRIAFVNEAGIVSAPALGGEIRMLIPHQPGARQYAPVLSPDGQWLAHATSDGHINLAAGDGSRSHRIAPVPDPHSLAWSPDGSRLAYVSGNHFFVWSVDGFANIAPSSIWTIRRDGSHAQRIAGPAGLNVSPAWMPDGGGLLFVSDAGGGRDIYYQRLRRDGKPAGAPQRLTTGLSVHGLSLSRDGRYLAYSNLATSSSIWSLRIPSAAGASLEEARQITSATERIESIAASPDGEWLLFDSDRSGSSKIYKMRVDGSGLQQLTTQAGDDFYPSWSPDGSWVAFHSWRSGSRDLYVIRSDGTDERLIVGGPLHAWGGTFSPDGKSLAYVGQTVQGAGVESVRLFVVPSAGGVPRQLSVEQASLATPLWTSDGMIVFAPAAGGLRLINPVSGATRDLALPGSWGEYRPHWIGGLTADKAAVYVRIRSGSEEGFHVARVPLDGEPASIVVRFDRPDRQTLRSEFGTDGHTLYFTVGQHQADIWVVELGKTR